MGARVKSQGDVKKVVLAIAMTIASAIIDDRYYPENRYYDDEKEHRYPDRYHHRRPPPSRYRGYDQWDEDPRTAHPVGAGQADPARGLRGALLFPATRTGCAGQGRRSLAHRVHKSEPARTLGGRRSRPRCHIASGSRASRNAACARWSAGTRLVVADHLCYTL